MKLRINNNTIRLRLTQPEVERIGNGMPVEETLRLIPFQEKNFSYRLVPCTESKTITAAFSSNLLLVKIPQPQSLHWATTEQVGLRHVQDEGNDNATTILIEKDFQCLHKRPDEDETNNFPNPMMR